MINKELEESISNINSDVLCWNSPRCYPRGSPDGWIGRIEVWATKNFIKDKITGRVDIVCRIFKKTAKKLKLKSQDLDVVLKVLQVVGSNFYKTYRYLPQEDSLKKLRWFINEGDI